MENRDRGTTVEVRQDADEETHRKMTKNILRYRLKIFMLELRTGKASKVYKKKI